MSISNENVEKLIREGVENADVAVSGDGYKYEARIVSVAFEGLNTMKRHQMIYAILNDVITSGELHALTIKAYTPDEV